MRVCYPIDSVNKVEAMYDKQKRKNYVCVMNNYNHLE